MRVLHRKHNGHEECGNPFHGCHGRGFQDHLKQEFRKDSCLIVNAVREHHIEEEQFYSRYGWCLNPILSIEELFDHLRDEVNHSATLTEWQREESVINIYLFVCAVACTL